jgi:uncharacterized protein (DUF2126 family)
MVRSHFEFRFPHYFTIEQRGIVLEIRHAIEPWPVLGVESTPGANARSKRDSVPPRKQKLPPAGQNDI